MTHVYINVVMHIYKEYNICCVMLVAYLKGVAAKLIKNTAKPLRTET
jgi:hypothetical protein